MCENEWADGWATSEGLSVCKASIRFQFVRPWMSWRCSWRLGLESYFVSCKFCKTCCTEQQPRSPNVPLLRALWSLFYGIWGLLKGSWGVLEDEWIIAISHHLSCGRAQSDAIVIMTYYEIGTRFTSRPPDKPKDGFYMGAHRCILPRGWGT